jgi:alpha-galactosidase
MKRNKITFVGGGSVAWTPYIVRDILLTESLRDSEIVLYDIDRKAAHLVAAFLERLKAKLKVPAIFTPTNERAKALRGADYVIVAISTGGLPSMAHDLSIPEEYGIFHTVGDTSGPGGWARLMRNFSVFKELGLAIRQSCPAAMVLNYTNPMTTLTTVLSRTCPGPVVGLCHALFENLEFLRRLYPDQPLEKIAMKYGGLNHFFWTTEIRGRGIDILADLRNKLQRRSITELLGKDSDSPDAMGFHSNRELATELFRVTGVLPYIGDRHTCEFFPSYITSQKNMVRYKLLRTSVKERQKTFVERTRNVKSMIKKGIPDDYTEKSRETAADIMGAHREGKPFTDVGNVPNIGQITNLPLGTIVETAVTVDRNGFTPLAFGALPDPIAGWVKPYADVFNLGVQACFEKSERLALHALRLDPVCSHLTQSQIEELGRRLLKAHRPYTSFLR